MRGSLKYRFLFILISILSMLSYAVQAGIPPTKPASVPQVPQTKSEPQRPRLKKAPKPVVNRFGRRRRQPGPTRVDTGTSQVAVASVTLTIKTNAPNTTIMLDGKSFGTTKPDGTLTLLSMPKQTYKLMASAPGYFDKEYPLDLTSGGDKPFEIKLDPKPGALTIMSVSGAKINISNSGSYITQVENLTAQAGNYTVEVSKPGYESATLMITVSPAGTANRAIPLRPLPPEKALAEADQHLQNKEYDIVLDIGETVLKTQPSNPQANALVGYSHYYSARFCQSLPYFLKALEGNEQIKLPIKTSSQKTSVDSLVEGWLVLRKGNVSFKPSEPQGITLDIGVQNIQDVKAEEKGGRIFTSFMSPSGADKKWEKTEVYFYPARATVTSAPKRTIECNSCQQELQMLFPLMQAVRK